MHPGFDLTIWRGAQRFAMPLPFWYVYAAMVGLAASSLCLSMATTLPAASVYHVIAFSVWPVLTSLGY